MEPTSGRLTFNMGTAFPSSDRVAVWLAALSTALNDLLTTSRWMVGGDANRPEALAVSDAERQYLLRLSLAQLFEVRETIKHGIKPSAEGDPPNPITTFVDGLPAEAQADLERILAINTDQDQWILQTIEHVRHQTNHYGGRWGWQEMEWALTIVAGEEGEIEMASQKLAGMRLRFADLVAGQHLLRKVPEYTADPTADLDEETIVKRLSTLFQIVADSVAAAQNFVIAALDHYLDQLPDDVVEAHPEWPAN